MTDSAPPVPRLLSDPERWSLARARLRARDTLRVLEAHAPAVLENRHPGRILTPTRAGTAAALALERRDDGTGDLFAPSHGAIAGVFLMGVTPLEFLRQALGRAAAPAEGRAPHPHWFDLARGIVGPVWPPGTSLEILAGMTLAARMRGETRVGLVFGGEGADSTGAWHEGLNFAAVRHCPLVVVMEAPSPLPWDRHPLRSHLERCEGYGVSGEAVPAEDEARLVSAIRDAVERARAGAGVQLIELLPSPGETRPPELGWDRLTELEREVRMEVEAARLQVDLDPLPAAELARSEVWACGPAPVPPAWPVPEGT